eukprot:272874_1
MSSRKPTAIVTGASAGIGRAIAIQLAKDSRYKLCLVSRNITKLQETKTLCQNANQNVLVLIMQCDLSNVNEIKQTFNKIGNEYGPICVLINNAGVGNSGYVEKADLKHWDKMIDTNLKAVVYSTNICLPFIIKAKQNNTNISCAIITIGSIKGTDIGIGLSPLNSSIYGATKHGVRIFTECLFEEVKKYGIKCCCIMPGLVKTEMAEEYAKSHPKLYGLEINKFMNPTDIAQSVQYILNTSAKACPTNLVIRAQYAKI